MAAADSASLRPAGADHLGLRHALSDRLLPSLVGAMVFLAALALAGAMAAASLAEHWKLGAASLVTVTVPMADAPEEGTAPARHEAPDATPTGTIAGRTGDATGGRMGDTTGGTTGPATGGTTRADAAARVLAASPGVALARRLAPEELAALLKPWLGADVAALDLHLPAMFELRVGPAGADRDLALRLARVAPGSLVDSNGPWLARLAELIRSLQACAALALLIVTFVAAAMVGVATRAGLAARREAIEIVHSLGATDGTIAGQFSRRVSVLVLVGACLGVALAVPVLLALAHLAAPFSTTSLANTQGLDQGQASGQATAPSLGESSGQSSDRSSGPPSGQSSGKPSDPSSSPPSGHSSGRSSREDQALDPPPAWPSLPPLLWALLACLPMAAVLIAWATAQITVHGWLRRVP